MCRSSQTWSPTLPEPPHSPSHLNIELVSSWFVVSPDKHRGDNRTESFRNCIKLERKEGRKGDIFMFYLDCIKLFTSVHVNVSVEVVVKGKEDTVMLMLSRFVHPDWICSKCRENVIGS